MDKGHQILRRAALERYYADPSICLFCNKVIPVREGRQPAEAKKKKFCNHSCSASFTNKGRADCSVMVCPDCGGKKDRKAKTCKKCLMVRNLQEMERRPIRELFFHGGARVKYAYIRKLAIRAMEIWGIDKTCEECSSREFDSIVQVHHVKRISNFNEDALIGEVNSRENMRYLCPNHHALVGKD